MREGQRIRLAALLASLFLACAGCGDDQEAMQGPSEALIVVSPHPDDESIFGGGTIYRRAADADTYVRGIYVSGGDRATVPGDCNGTPEADKTRMIVELREGETRAAWHVLVPDRDVPIDFLRGPDQGLVASSTVVGGIRQDVLTPEGEQVAERAVALALQVPDSVRAVLFLTTSIYDAHPDHRVAYHAARRAAAILRDERRLEVRIWSWIVHDEIEMLDMPICCAGDFHWPSAGPTNDYLALTDAPGRSRPPHWNRVEDVSDLTAVRRAALNRHVSQVVGYPPLCMPVYIPTFYTRWTEKVEEPFYEEVL